MLIDGLVGREGKVQQFYIHSILIDVLMNLVNAINQVNVELSCYENLYYETLYYCRSQSYALKSREITANIHSLLELYKEKWLEKMEGLELFASICEENFSQPELSSNSDFQMSSISFSRKPVLS